MFDFRNYSTKSKYYDDSNKLVIGKMKYKTGGVAIEEFLRLKPKMYWFLVDNNDHKKTKGVNKNVVAITNIIIFCWIKSVWHIRWIGFKVKIIK